jgi:Uma2 family endonuclease
MNLHSSAPTDPDAFLRWNEGREGRRELVNGRVVEMMIGATWGHARRVRRLARALEDHLDEERFEVGTNDVGVRTSAGIRYPDLVVDSAGGDAARLRATSPVLIAEVLSHSTMQVDLIEKAAEYTALTSLQAYLVLSQDEPRAWFWLREGEGWSGPATIEGPGAEIAVPALSLAIPLRLVYPDAPAA